MLAPKEAQRCMGCGDRKRRNVLKRKGKRGSINEKDAKPGIHLPEISIY
jgi:hypothetical protein